MIDKFDEVQRLGQNGLDATVQSVEEWNKGLQQIAEELGVFAKQSVAESASSLERMITAGSLEQMLEIQTNYCRSAYEGYIAQWSRLGDVYAGSVKRAYRPIERAMLAAN